MSSSLSRQPSLIRRRILASAGAATALATVGSLGAIGSADAAAAAPANGASTTAARHVPHPTHPARTTPSHSSNPAPTTTPAQRSQPAPGRVASTSLSSAQSAPATQSAPAAQPGVHSWRGMSWPAAAAGSRRSVEFVDHTGWSWPVHAAARNWSVGPDVGYVPVSQCTPGMPCVQVYEGYFGATGWNGETLASPGLMNTFASPVTVELNDSYAGSYSQHLGTACHELGHALGLDHAPRQSSCMAPSAGASTPDATDLNDLELLYRGG